MLEMLHDAHAWVVLSFLLFCLLAWKFGRKPALQKLDSRIELIRAEIETAEALRVQAEALVAEYRQKQQEAETESRRIVEHAQKHAGEVRRTMEQDLQAAAHRREQQLADRLKRMEEAAVNEIRARAAELAVQATAELIAAHMDEKTNARLIDDSIKELAKVA